MVALSKEKLDEQWYSFMHLLLERMQKTFLSQGLSQKDIADRLEKDTGFVSRCLNGRQNMTMRTVHDLARAMDCRLDMTFVPLKSLKPANNQPRPAPAASASHHTYFNPSQQEVAAA